MTARVITKIKNKYIDPYKPDTVTREPRTRDSEAKGPREYWWWHRAYGVLAPSIRSISGKLGSFAGIPKLRGTPESRDYSECSEC